VNGKSRGRCVVKDGLAPVLEKMHNSDGLILGSPIYFSEVSATVRALIERLLFQYTTYKKEGGTFFNRHIPVVLIYTMNVSESMVDKLGHNTLFEGYERRFGLIGPVKTLR
jgi:multimeric flavodoxin WrbA